MVAIALFIEYAYQSEGLFRLGCSGMIGLESVIGATYATDFRDITSGSKGTCSAGPGYDFVTGLGSPLANNLAPGLKDMN
jgi:hypothetical protein